MQNNEIQGFVENYFKENNLNEFFFVDARISDGRKVEVFVDKDGGINFKECQKLSRYLEGIFDESQQFGENYILEVSSPGVGSPLKKKRQYKNNIGRNIIAKTTDSKYKGKLIDVIEEKIIIEEQVTVKVGPKKKKKEMIQHNIFFDDILEAKIKVSFK